jgi:hypothetical protein
MPQIASSQLAPRGDAHRENAEGLEIAFANGSF